jgi:DivIVA domain-containing protein
MSWWSWVLAVVMIGLVVLEVSDILGPFELDDAERPADATWWQLVRAWGRGWLRRPREPLSFGDWVPHSGRMFLPTLLAVGLVYSGPWVLFGSGETFRLGGALALVAGIPLLLSIVGYVARPVGELTPGPVGSRFPTVRRGYDAAEVDRAFAELSTMSRDDLKRLRFRTTRPGYDMDAVDGALDEAAQARLT